MNFNKLNKKGITFLDTLVSLLILMIIILMISCFNEFLKNSSFEIDNSTYLLETINTEINSVYNQEDWTILTNKVINCKSGNIYVNFSNYVNITQYNTSEITVEFKFNDKSKIYNLERSVFKNV